MNHRIVFLLFFLPLVWQVLPAQNAGDALRFSRFEVGGTGRFIGVGGSLGALGTEFSVLSTNPAGLAMYRSSEFVVSPGVLSTKTSSVLDGAYFPGEDVYLPQPGENKTFEESRTVFNLNNLGFIIQTSPRRNPDFATLNFGIGFNHLANFNQRFTYEGETAGSIAERWKERANTVPFDNDRRPIDFEAGPAWDAYAVYELDPPDGNFFVDYDLTYDADGVGNVLRRNQTVEAKGSMSELVFAIAGNYRERVMAGLTVGVPILNYRVSRDYREFDDNPNPETGVPFFDDLRFEETLTTTGAGVNAKLGLLVRVSQALRLGAAVHTPTSLSLNDEYQLAISYNFTDDQGPFSGFGESGEGLFDYRLSTPWRFFGNAGFLFNKIGFLTAEVEWVNYQKARFRYTDFPEDEAAANADIAAVLDQAVNIRIGGEAAYKALRFRAGLGFLPSPYQGDSSTDLSYSAGLGFRSKAFFADFAWRNTRQSEGFIPYGASSAPQQFINNETTLTSLVLSVGLRY